MCGRFTLTTPAELATELAGMDIPFDLGTELAPRYNIAPTQSVLTVANRSTPSCEYMRWGLVPGWAKDLSIGHKLINARGESLRDKPAFRDSFARRRCLVPADGFYEWRRDGGRRVPYYVRRTSQRPFWFAGLWAVHRGADGGAPTVSFTIVTTDANPLIAPIHDRMPVIVESADAERWLCPDPVPPDALQDILRPADVGDFELFEVSARVNSPRLDDPRCIEPGPIQQRLF